MLLTATLPSTAGAEASYSVAAMVAFEAGLPSVGTLLLLSRGLGAPQQHHALLLGTAAGVLFGVSDVAIKALTGAVADSGTVGLLSPWLVPCALASATRSPAAWSSSGTPRATRWASCSRASRSCS